MVGVRGGRGGSGNSSPPLNRAVTAGQNQMNRGNTSNFQQAAPQAEESASFMLQLLRLRHRCRQCMNWGHCPCLVGSSKFIPALIVVTLYVLVGMVGYYHLEPDWSLGDSAYFSMVALTTVGYGCMSPTSAASRIFTMFYAVLSSTPSTAQNTPR